MPINSFENYPMSWKPVLGPDKHPLYLYLAAQLEKDIKEGVLLPGTKLPPQRELADFLDINVSTITRAFKLCTQKGLLNGTIGRGTFVAYNALECFKMLPQSDKNLIEMGSMAPACIAYKELYDVMQALLMEPNFGQLLHYGLDQGAIWQKEAAVKFIAKMGYITTEDKVLPAAGGQNAIAAILAGVFRAGDSIGVDPLTYPGIKSVASMDNSDVVLSICLSIIVLCLFVVFYNRIFAVTFDENFARATGINAEVYNALIAFLSAVTIVLGMRMMGALLISSLIVFPPLSSMQVFKTFRQVILSSALLSVACFFVGLCVSYLWSTPTGSSVVMANIVAFLIFYVLGKIQGRIKQQ